VLVFDGSYSRDSTVLVGATVEERPHLFVVRVWERPGGDPRWRTSPSEVEAELEAAMEDYDVAELAPDPPGWHHEVEKWELKYGEVVVRFETNQPTRMGPACDEFNQGLRGDEDNPDGGFTHDGHPAAARHIAHCVARQRGRWLVIDKEHPDSPLKIDIAAGFVIAYHRAHWHFLNPPRKKWTRPAVAVR
jgi:hypothetical protein